MIIALVTMLVIVSSMIALTALYVGGEFAAVSSRKSRVAQAAQQGNRLAKMILPILEDHRKLDNYIAASQVGITLSSVVLGIYGQQQIAPHIENFLVDNFSLDHTAAAGFATTGVLLAMTALQVIFGELVPKSLALQNPERIAYLTALPMLWSANYILRPLIIVLNGNGVLLLRLMGADHSEGHKHVHSPEEIQFLIEQSHAGGVLATEERQLLDNAFRFGELRIGEIVVPRTRMFAASINTPVNKLLEQAAQSDYTRIPIFENTIDHIVGFVHLKDLFRLYHRQQDQSIRSILRKASFVPETVLADEVWKIMDKERSYLAIVIDEYGGTFGMVTREDLIEELFGEVQDEFDQDEIPPIQQITDTEFKVRGDVSLSFLNERLDVELPHEDTYTVGGLILNHLERLPVVGDTFEIQRLRFRVDQIREKTIDLVTVICLPNETASEEDAS